MVRRWETQLADAGVGGLLGEPKGPKRKSKLTADTVSGIRRLRAGGESYRGIAAETGVSVGSVRNALVLAGGGPAVEQPCQVTVSDTGLEPGLGAQEGPQAQPECVTAVGDDRGVSCPRGRRCWPIRHRVASSARWRGSG